MELNALLTEFIAREASDLHLIVGKPPVFRINGQLMPAEALVLDAAGMEALLLPLLTEEHKMSLATHRQDIELTVRQEEAVFRCQVFRAHDGLGASLRLIPARIPSLAELSLPPIFEQLTHQPRGLILLTGATGSGKTTTLAAMVNHINLTRAERIFTLEDPISYVFSSGLSLVTQRVVGEDIESYEQGAISTLRSDPDVVFIGEMPTLEVVRAALVLAETGHLVFSQLHSENVSEAVQRLIEVFPEPRETIRRMLARTVQAVIAQKLLVRSAGRGRVAANEIMIATPRIRQMIAAGQTDLTLAIEAGRDQGMQTMDDSVLKYYQEGTITYETAWQAMNDHTRLGPELKS